MDSSRTKSPRVLSQTKPAKVKLPETSQPLLASKDHLAIYDHQKANGSPFLLPPSSSVQIIFKPKFSTPKPTNSFLLSCSHFPTFLSVADLFSHYFANQNWLQTHMYTHTIDFLLKTSIKTPFTKKKKPVNFIKIKTSSRFHYPCTDKTIRKHFLKYP